ncbi:DUF4910 domain-containing protein [Pseudoalteromonas peptidolytica]|uniref:Aminopeptidase n=1 Tax=Pseudoalteromonas peptidolytica F12-50-A1 TaxID=1315280 RepID=A0A8I0MU39_9GAMM|nr:DUF4910 domain-containing protein [Pseudoalteromonas peptidolytica]MBE0345473.1 hypothetical protein [Pseudoalteromonas peptidolytica F12-50-A1]NLR13419.1 DUF4910 domain-containing protein [Pseudoalteromonas peptidolytica]GEK10164.1 aminopeptidase [Pseudoalteromonas peptidolytica]
MDRENEYKLLDSLFDELFPLCRSITGYGIEASMEIISRYMPLQFDRVKSGTQVFDWQVPPQWNFCRARLWDPNGNVVCDTNINNLHVVSYSEPVDQFLTLDELLPHLHSLPDMPEAIPYVTSYYKRTWGFCLKHSDKQMLQPGRYRVLIESEFDPEGGVPFAQTTLEGENSKEILLSSYLCHPSLANNELSGPLVLLGLYNRLSKWPTRHYSYRFLLNPETIGSLCFLYKNYQSLSDNLEAGLILTCLGGDVDTLRYKASRKGNTTYDQLANHLASHKQLRYVDFTPLHGSDERQYCAPGFNLPVAQVSRSLNIAKVPYHTSLDNKESMNMARIIQSIDELEKLLQLGEVAGVAVNQSPFGEPQLGKRGLYPNMNTLEHTNKSSDNLVDGRTKLNAILTILSDSDGTKSMVQIAESLNLTLFQMVPIIKELEQHGLIKFNTGEVL